jgi:hypothetical protein
LGRGHLGFVVALEPEGAARRAAAVARLSRRKRTSVPSLTSRMSMMGERRRAKRQHRERGVHKSH